MEFWSDLTAVAERGLMVPGLLCFLSRHDSDSLKCLDATTFVIVECISIFQKELISTRLLFQTVKHEQRSDT